MPESTKEFYEAIDSWEKYKRKRAILLILKYQLGFLFG
jgi:hypothetical protein